MTHLPFRLQPSSGVPIYLQLIEQIRHAIESCALAPGDQLPAIRALAQQFVISPNTVLKAYTELDRDGIIELRQGSGAFVADRESPPHRDREVRFARAAMHEVVARLRRHGFSDDEMRRFWKPRSWRRKRRAHDHRDLRAHQTVPRQSGRGFARPRRTRGQHQRLPRSQRKRPTTTIKMFLDMVHATSGEALVFGEPASNVSIRERVGYVAEDKRLYGNMTVARILDFTRPFYPDWSRDRERALLRRFDLPLHRKVRALSKGMHSKLALVLALSHGAQLLILHEPGEGLDPVANEQTLECIIDAAGEGAAVFFSTHQVSRSGADRGPRVHPQRRAARVPGLARRPARQLPARSRRVSGTRSA